MSRTQLCQTPPAPLSGFFMKKRKWPLKGYHKRYFSIKSGILKYGKHPNEVEKIAGKIHGQMDLGDAAITNTKKQCCVHLDTGHSGEAPIHIKPLGTSNKADKRIAFDKLLASIREHREYRRREKGQNSKSFITSPWSTIDSTSGSLTRFGVAPSFSQMTSIDETTNTTNTEKIEKIEESIGALENYIVKLTQNRALFEEFVTTQSSPKKTSVAGKMKNSIRKRRDKGSTGSNGNEGSVTTSMNLDSGSCSLDKSKSLSQPDLSISSNSSPNSPNDLKPVEILREFEKLARTTVNQISAVLLEQKSRESRRSTDRSADGLIFELKRENTELKRILSTINTMSSLEQLGIEKVKSRTSFRTNSLEQQTSLVRAVEESINGSSRDLFYDCEEDFYMSDSDASSDDEHTDAEQDDTDGQSINTDSDVETETEPEISLKSNDLVGPMGFQRRQTLPVYMSAEAEVNLWGILKKNIGKDLTKVAMPVAINQPLSALQRIAEDLEYSELLDEAVALSGVDRMVKVAAFALSTYAKDSTRPGRKPFNPILGETYELVREDKGWKFFAEQVSHHAPISAAVCEGQGWEVEILGRWKNKFWGKSMEIHPLGETRITFKDNERFTFNQVTSCVHGLLSGEKYIEFYGEKVVKSSKGLTAKFTFQKSGWMSGSKNEVIGEIKDENNKKIKSMFGRWDEGIYQGDSRQTARCIWRQSALPIDSDKYYGFTRFALELNEILEIHRDSLPHTDSRRRTDQRCLENGDLAKAEEEKKRIEELQRSVARQRTERGEKYMPRFFDPDGDNWKNKKKYWAVRDDAEFWDNVNRIW